MSSLFDNAQLQKKLNEYKVETQDNSAIFLKWHNDNQKEEALQTNFLNDIFGKVLGYEIDTGEAEFNLLTEYKTQKDGTKVDGVLGFITKDKKDIRVAIELKAKNTTNLDSVEKQAFEYRDKIDGIEWVITSNTSEIRLYSAGSGGRLKHQSWTLKELAESIDKQKAFYFLLSKDRLFTKTPNQSPVHSLDTTAKGEEIEKRFYKHYSTLREEIWHNLLDLNKEKHYGRNFYLYKAQKLIDRIIFIRFCRENGALDNDAVVEALNNKFVPGKYNRLKFLFQAMDEGNPEIGIAKFNGGLFATDPDLDCLNISDDIIDKIVILYSHDFGSDLDVNILGHIFEQSISDLESLTGDNEKKRKKDGVFYTPAYITEYIVREAVGGWLADRKAEIKAKENSKDWWQQYANSLKSIKVLDPACGSGAFLVKVFDYLQKEWREVQKHIKTDWAYKDILTYNIYGVDINPASTGITKLSLWLKTAHYREPLTTLDGNIKIGNSLIDNPDIAGYYSEFEGKVLQEVIAKDLFNASDLEKLTAEGVKKSLAFKWNEEFKEVFDQGGFDVVVGNPPYVSAVTMKLSQETRNYYINRFQYIEGAFDLYLLFLLQAKKILNESGKFGWIIPNKLLQSNYSQKALEYLASNNLCNSYNVSALNVFEGVSVYPIIFCGHKGNGLKKYNILNFETFHLQEDIDIFKEYKTFKDFNIKIECGAAGFEASHIAKNILETKQENFIPFIVSGSIDHYSIDYENVQYMKKNYKNAFVNINCVSENRKRLWLNEKIIIAGMTKRVEAFYSQESIGLGVGCYAISDYQNFHPLFLLALLNSRFMTYYITKKFKDKHLAGGYLAINAGNMEQFPLVFTEAQLPLITHAQTMLDLTKQFNELSNKFTKLLGADLSVAKITKKLEKWYNLQADEFFAEVGKQNKNLSLSSKSQWLEHFEVEKQRALALQSQITKTDAEIDKMVYALYGLSEEEIGVIEGFGCRINLL
jgi:type I restriction-modification system DNA methylase subunit